LSCLNNFLQNFRVLLGEYFNFPLLIKLCTTLAQLVDGFIVM